MGKNFFDGVLVTLYYDHLQRYFALPSQYPGFNLINVGTRGFLQLEARDVKNSLNTLEKRLNEPPIRLRSSEVKLEAKVADNSTQLRKSKIDSLQKNKIEITTRRNQLVENRKWYYRNTFWAGLSISKKLRQEIQTLEQKNKKLRVEIKRIDYKKRSNQINEIDYKKRSNPINENAKKNLVQQVISKVGVDFNAVSKDSQQKLETLLLNVLNNGKLQTELADLSNSATIVDALVSKVQLAVHKKFFSFWGPAKEIYFKDPSLFGRLQPEGRALSEQMLVNSVREEVDSYQAAALAALY